MLACCGLSPLQVGKCCVENKLITLAFPFTSIAFNCPIAPADLKQPTNAFKVDFKVIIHFNLLREL